MTVMEMWAVAVVCGICVFGISVLLKFRTLAQEKKDREEMIRVDREAAEARARARKAMDTETARRYANLTSTKNSQTQIVSNNSVGIQSRGTVNVDDDTLTNMIIWNTLNSNSGMVSATVDRDTGTYEIREEPSRSSSYSSSYSSSSDDDSSRRSSYSSSYSSSSSDDSYSSSSSDSSYSSSSD